MTQVFRLARAALSSSIWSGEGGLFVDGRWHTPGRRIVYTAQSLSLAQLEVLVHITDRRQMPALAYAVAGIPDGIAIETIEPSHLEADWRRFSPYSAETQRLGMAWLTAQSSAVLRVPSAISELEWNYLLNPEHPAFTELTLGAPTPFAMDPRIPARVSSPVPRPAREKRAPLPPTVA